MDYQTGEKVGVLEIEPPSIYQEDGFVRDFTYDQITASDKFVSVYYADNQQLIVFEQTD